MLDDQEVLATVKATQSRRVVGLAAMTGLGCLLVYNSFVQDVGAVLRAGLMVAGVASLIGSRVLWRGTSSAVELTAAGLRDADGTVIAELGNVSAVDRGVFAFKPSNGFTVRLHASRSTQWRLGLWWRAGKRIGIGGMTPAHQAKLMSERLDTLVKDAGAAQQNGPQG